MATAATGVRGLKLTLILAGMAFFFEKTKNKIDKNDQNPEC